MYAILIYRLCIIKKTIGLCGLIICHLFQNVFNTRFIEKKKNSSTKEIRQNISMILIYLINISRVSRVTFATYSFRRKKKINT